MTLLSNRNATRGVQHSFHILLKRHVGKAHLSGAGFSCIRIDRWQQDVPELHLLRYSAPVISYSHGLCTDAENKSKGGHRMILHNDERRKWLQPWKPSSQGLETPVCSMALPPAVGSTWAGPRIRMQLPSFSGATAECPQLLQYTCQLCTNVRAVPATCVEVRILSP